MRVDAKLEERGERILRRRKEGGEGRRRGRRRERRGEGAARAGAELQSQVLRLVQVKARARVVGIEYPQHQALVIKREIFDFFLLRPIFKCRFCPHGPHAGLKHLLDRFSQPC